MPGLTEKEKRDFALVMKKILVEATQDLLDSGIDPATRITQLETLHQTATDKEGIQAMKEIGARVSTEISDESTTLAYRQASDTKTQIVGLLGKNDPRSIELGQMRDHENMTKASMRDFVFQIVNFLEGQTESLATAGFDVSDRITELQGKGTTATDNEAQQQLAHAGAVQATSDSVAATEEAYALASAIADLVVGTLGIDHPVSRMIRHLRKKPGKASGPPEETEEPPEQPEEPPGE